MLSEKNNLPIIFVRFYGFFDNYLYICKVFISTSRVFICTPTELGYATVVRRCELRED